MKTPPIREAGVNHDLVFLEDEKILPKNVSPKNLSPGSSSYFNPYFNRWKTNNLNTQPQIIPRIPAEDEVNLLPDIQVALFEARQIGEIQHIPPDQIWVHKTFYNIWYNSFDVGKVIAKIIPRAMTNGFERPDEFATPTLAQHAPLLDRHGFSGWKTFIEDMNFTTDGTLLNNIACGSPQSCMIPFESMVFKNLPMTEHGKQKVRDNHLKQIQLEKCSPYLPPAVIEKMLPIYVSNPEGVIPKNSNEKTKLLLYVKLTLQDVKTRTILHVSKEGANGCSVNNCTSYETLHQAQFVRVQDVESQVLLAVERLKEIGFVDWRNRILIFKTDITAAYRIMMSAVSDYFLGVHGIDDSFIIEYAQQFGQKSSVTIFHRFVYAITSLLSQPGMANKWFPEMALNLKGKEPLTSRPDPDSILKELQRFKDGDVNGTMDPAVFMFISWYLDDMMGICIDIRDDISTPLKPDEDGIRNPIGKALNFFLKRWGVPQNIEKRYSENDALLMGSSKPIILGIQFDLIELRLYVRKEFADMLAERLERWVQEGCRKSHPAEEWGLLQGRLAFATIVYPAFKCFMKEIFMTFAHIIAKKVRAWRPSPNILKNLTFLAASLKRNNGRAIMHNKAWQHSIQKGLQFCCTDPVNKIVMHDNSQHVVMHDASTDWGFGFVNTNTGEHYRRNYRGAKELWLASNKKIFVLEAIGMFIAFFVNKCHLKDSKINLVGDNLGLVTSFRYCGSNNPMVDEIARHFVTILADHGIQLNCDRDKFDANWCDTHMMEPADALSRNDMDTFYKWTQQKFPERSFIQLTEADERVYEAEKLMSSILDEFFTYSYKQ